MYQETMQEPRTAPGERVRGKRRPTPCAAADEQGMAIREAIAAHGSVVLGVATKVLRDPILAEDVAQDTFVAFWRQRDRIDLDRGSARVLLCSIARNKAIDLVRREEAQRRVRHAAETAAPPVAPDAFMGVDDRQSVLGALESLTELQREAITLAYFGGRTYREVALELGIPEGTAKTRLRDGLMALRNALTPVAPA